MLKIFNLRACKRMMPVLLTLSLLSACGNSDLKQVTETSTTQMTFDLQRRMALIAVESVAANLDAMLDLGGNPSWAEGEIAGRLASSMNSAQAPDPGDHQAPGPKFTYVADQASGPWQVVIKAEGETLQVTAYGSNASQPLEQRKIQITRN